MVLLTIIALMIIGSSFCGGILLLVMQKKWLGISLMIFAVFAYIAYVYIANTYFS